MELVLNDELGSISYEVSETSNPSAQIIIAHGAGAGMHHPFMVELANSIASKGIVAARFNFPYMEQGKKTPGSPKKNIETWKLVVEHAKKLLPSVPIYLSGKSYGGRMASHLVVAPDCPKVDGLVYFGFPLHAPGRDSKDRAAHLQNIKVPQLFLQGEKDKLANMEMMREVVSELGSANMLEYEGADHSFNVPKKMGKTKSEMIQLLASDAVAFIKSQQ